MSHIMEDIFSTIKPNPTKLSQNIINDLFRANDKLAELIESIKNNTSISYKGILARLKVILRNLHENDSVIERENDNSASHIINTSHEAPPNLLSNTDELLLDSLFVEKTPTKTSFTDVISIPVKKLDSLLNLVEELTIERDRIITLATDTGDIFRNEFDRLQRITSELQYAVMDARLVQVNLLFQKFHRIIRDIASVENKKVNLVLEGTEIEIDRNILQIISDAMIHLVRNAISHGIESPEGRITGNKKTEGTILLKAYNEKEKVIIEVKDDGKGIDQNRIKKSILEKGFMTPEILNKMDEQEILSFIFEAGFSSADKVSEISGRGVGMDVVKNVVESIGGKVSLSTIVGVGTTFRLDLPSSMAVKPVLLFILNSDEYAMPLTYIEAVLTLQKKDLFKAGAGLVSSYLNQTIPVIYLHDFFEPSHAHKDSGPAFYYKSFDKESENSKIFTIILNDGSRTLGVIVDNLLHQKEVIEKQLKAPLDNLRFISGATILGHGNVCLVLDVPSIISFIFKLNRSY